VRAACWKRSLRLPEGLHGKLYGRQLHNTQAQLSTGGSLAGTRAHIKCGKPEAMIFQGSEGSERAYARSAQVWTGGPLKCGVFGMRAGKEGEDYRGMAHAHLEFRHAASMPHVHVHGIDAGSMPHLHVLNLRHLWSRGGVTKYITLKRCSR